MATSRRRSLFVILMLVALVAGLISPVTADEPRLEQRPVAKRAEHTGAAWTAARMRNARPRDIVLPAEAHERGGPSVAQTSRPGRRGPSEPTAIRIHSSSMLESDLVTTGPPAEVTTDYKTFPLSTHGKVFFSDGAGDYVCSATAIDSANLSVVWTAGHCVHEGGFTGDWYVDWEFVPAYKDGATPLGTWEAERMWSPPQWVNNQDIRYDYAVVVVEPSAAGNKLTEVTGGRGIKWSQVREQDFQAFGYPAAPPFDGEWMFTCNSPYLGADADHPGPGPATMAIDCEMSEGSSGGGWIIEGRYLNSENSYSLVGQEEIMYGPYLDDNAGALFETAEAWGASEPSPSPTVSPPPNPTPAEHSMRLGIKLRKHLIVRGKLTAADGFAACGGFSPVGVLRKGRSGWKLVKQTTTNLNGVYKMKIKDRRGRYLTYAPDGIVGPDGLDHCTEAQSRVVRHRHRR